MGGFAVIIDWDRPIDRPSVDTMLELIPSRATGGSHTVAFGHGVLAETRTTSQTDNTPWEIATRGPLAIAGDIRLIHRDRLRTAAGGHTATAALCDRQLILAAYERRDIGFLESIDGDYAFVIWNEQDRTALAVRDRFGARPIFFERTQTGVRFATEIKQLVATSTHRPEPNAISIAEYLLGAFTETRHTFFEGIERVRPSDALLFTPHRETRHRYWSPGTELDRTLAGNDVPHLFREHLTEATRQRLAWSPRSVAHLSGGLDSTTVVAAAQLLQHADPGSVDLETVSMVYPGYEADESRWIDDIAGTQSFTNHQFTPQIETADRFSNDVWVADSPRIDPVPDGSIRTAAIANDIGAGLTLTGFGGDYVLDASQVPQDLLAAGQINQWYTALRRRAAWLGTRTATEAVSSAKLAAPRSAKAVHRRIRPHRNPRGPILTPELRQSYTAATPETEPMESGLATRTANLLAGEARDPVLVLTHELLEPTYARFAIELANPYLDRQLYEFVTSIPCQTYPYDGSSKPVARQAFAGLLPDSVTRRRKKTVMDDFLAAAFAHHVPGLVQRYPAVPHHSAAFISADWYRDALSVLDTATTTSCHRRSMWSAWTVMIWLESFGRYQ